MPTLTGCHGGVVGCQTNQEAAQGARISVSPATKLPQVSSLLNLLLLTISPTLRNQPIRGSLPTPLDLVRFQRRSSTVTSNAIIAKATRTTKPSHTRARTHTNTTHGQFKGVHFSRITAPPAQPDERCTRYEPPRPINADFYPLSAGSGRTGVSGEDTICRPHDSCSAVPDDGYSHGNTCARTSGCAEAARTPVRTRRLSIRHRIAAAVQSQGCSFRSLGGRDPVHLFWTGETTTFLLFCMSSGQTILTLCRSDDDAVR